MSFKRVIERTWGENVLFSVLVELTYRCNLDCYFCYNDVALTGAPLTLDEYRRFFEDLRDMQVLHVILSGGEPLAHPNFFDLGGFARELGFVVRVKSNGHALRGRIAERLKKEVDPFLVEISLHGACAATHDRQTRVPGSFDRLLENLVEMAEHGIRVKLNSTLTRWNEAEIEEMFALADGLALPLQVDPEVTPRDDGDPGPLSVAPTREGMTRLYRLQGERARTASEASHRAQTEVGRQDGDLMGATTSDKYCGAGAGGVAVDPYGNVYPCVQWRRPVGNLHDRRISEIWRSSTGLDEVRELNKEVKRQLDSEGDRQLGFCPGLAETRSGDPLEIYPSVRQRSKVVSEVEQARRPLPVIS